VNFLYVGSPLLPLKVTGKKVAKDIESSIKEKNWHEFKIATLKLSLVPYFLFNYHYFKEKEVNGEKIIESSVDGFLLLNGESVSVEKDLSNLVKSNIKDVSNEAPLIPFEEKETTIDKKEQSEIIQFKIAEYFHVPKENVVISNVKKVLIPFYETFVEVKEGIFNIKINAVDGKVYGIDEVPEREKGFVELTKETINDLKDPKKWIEYTKELLVESGKFTKNKGKKVSIITSKKIIEKTKKKEFLSSLTNMFMSNWFLILLIIIALFLIWVGLFSN
jgi:hypothetical protein